MAASNEVGAVVGHDQRRSPRFRHFGAIFLSWMGPRGKNYVMGRCVDISAGGLGVEIASRLSLNTEVTVRAEWANLNGAATVRHIANRGGVFHLGLELKNPFPPEVLAKLVALGSEGTQIPSRVE
jgi:hypothetical protein